MFLINFLPIWAYKIHKIIESGVNWDAEHEYAIISSDLLITFRETMNELYNASLV